MNIKQKIAAEVEKLARRMDAEITDASQYKHAGIFDTWHGNQKTFSNWANRFKHKGGHAITPSDEGGPNSEFMVHSNDLPKLHHMLKIHHQEENLPGVSDFIKDQVRHK